MLGSSLKLLHFILTTELINKWFPIEWSTTCSELVHTCMEGPTECCPVVNNHQNSLLTGIMLLYIMSVMADTHDAVTPIRWLI